MKNLRKKITILILLAVCALLIYLAISRDIVTVPGSLNLGSSSDVSETVDISEEGPLHTVGYMAEAGDAAAPVNLRPIGDDQPVSRGMAAKMLSLALKSGSDIQALHMAGPVHQFADVSVSHWHAPYINAAYVLEIMRGNGERFVPDAPLTIGQAQILLRVVDPQNAPAFANVLDPNQPISYALWVDLYKQLLEGLSEGRTIYEAFGIIAMDIIVLATAANSTLPEGHLISDKGPLGHRGLTMDAYIDQQLRVLVKDREIVALSALISEQPVLKNAYIVESGAGGASVFIGGAERFFYWEDSGVPANTVADIMICSGRILSVMPFGDSISGTLLRASERVIELKGHGLFPVDADFRVYDVLTGAVRLRNQAHLIVGTDTARFYLRDGAVAAGVITHEAFPENIRVVIGTSNFAGLTHSSVTITSTGNFWVTAGGVDADGEAERLLELAPGQRFTVSDIENTSLLGHPRLFVHAEPGEALQLTGLGRNWPQNASPRYRGIIEIAREENGYSLVNVLCLEEYLYAVVPSEMPSGYGVEASKVQAVTARSFAVHQIMANRFHALGGNVDDSVMSQVYNNIPENEVSIEAVEATRGLVLWYGDEVVRANFFSTSAGMTANSGEVWASGAAFPGYTPTFLEARPQFAGADEGMNLSGEAQAAEFFRNQEVDAYDSHSPWFRWQVEMTPAEIAASVNAQLEARFAANPSLIRTAGADGGWHSRPVASIGSLRSLQVLRRGEGGNIMELRITGDAADIIVATEFNIRSLLRPARSADGGRDIPLRRHDGSTLLNHSMLPSGFFSIEKVLDEEGAIEWIIFHGGGHGHGVGMSQNGVRGMVERGYSFDEIIRHFYPGVVLEAIDIEF